jgi:hypothetical protein
MIRVSQILTVFLLSVFVGCSETFDSSYDTLADAEQAGAFQRGWLPRCLPPTARSIRERHDIDTNRGWITLEFSPNDSLVFTGTLERIPASLVRHLGLPAPGVRWWHPLLRRGKLNTAGESGFQFFTVEFRDSNDAGTVFINQWFFAAKLSEGIAFGWSTTILKPRDSREGGHD